MPYEYNMIKEFGFLDDLKEGSGFEVLELGCGGTGFYFIKQHYDNWKSLSQFTLVDFVGTLAKDSDLEKSAISRESKLIQELIHKGLRFEHFGIESLLFKDTEEIAALKQKIAAKFTSIFSFAKDENACAEEALLQLKSSYSDDLYRNKANWVENPKQFDLIYHCHGFARHWTWLTPDHLGHLLKPGGAAVIVGYSGFSTSAEEIAIRMESHDNTFVSDTLKVWIHGCYGGDAIYVIVVEKPLT